MPLYLDTLTAADLDHVGANLRPYDRDELAVMDYGEEKWRTHLGQPYAYALRTPQGRPVAVGGAVKPEAHEPLHGLPECLPAPVSSYLFIWGFGTPEAEKSWPQIHRQVTAFLKFLEEVEAGRTPAVLVWEGHGTSLRWLGRLGFRRAGPTFLGRGNETVVFMEKT